MSRAEPSGWGRWLRLVAALGLVIVAYFLLPAGFDLRLRTLARGLLTLGCVAGLAVLITVQLRRHVDDFSRRADGLVVAIVVVVVVFAFAVYTMSVLQPQQFVGIRTKVDALYFTMTTMTTVGYGDIHAEGQAARVLVLVQMTFDVVFVAALAALVSSRLKSAAQLRSERRRPTRSAPTSTDAHHRTDGSVADDPLSPAEGDAARTTLRKSPGQAGLPIERAP